MIDIHRPALHVHIRPCQPAHFPDSAGGPDHDKNHRQIHPVTAVWLHKVKKNLLLPSGQRFPPPDSLISFQASFCRILPYQIIVHGKFQSRHNQIVVVHPNRGIRIPALTQTGIEFLYMDFLNGGDGHLAKRSALYVQYPQLLIFLSGLVLDLPFGTQIHLEKAVERHLCGSGRVNAVVSVPLDCFFLLTQGQIVPLARRGSVRGDQLPAVHAPPLSCIIVPVFIFPVASLTLPVPEYPPFAVCSLFSCHIVPPFYKCQDGQQALLYPAAAPDLFTFSASCPSSRPF